MKPPRIRPWTTETAISVALYVIAAALASMSLACFGEPHAAWLWGDFLGINHQ